MTIVSYAHTFFGCHGKDALDILQYLVNEDYYEWVKNVTDSNDDSVQNGIGLINNELKRIDSELTFNFFPMSLNYHDKDIPYLRLGREEIIDGEDNIDEPQFKNILFQSYELKDIIDSHKLLKKYFSYDINMGICTLTTTKEI
jgi:hypothetical protein